MKILVDADSCPKAARELVIRRAAKLSLCVVFAANRPIPGVKRENSSLDYALSAAENVIMEICPVLDNSADDRIVELAESGDIAVTRDIPLAKRLIEKNVITLDDRGRVFTQNNINEFLSLRNFMTGLADNGLEIQRTANYGRKELKTFADSLDKILARFLKRVYSPEDRFYALNASGY
ncbi:MAG: DUF188 domain-containing protein [Treponema sp.]|nr:DUF188 domain-containing protein [Treponema sp.]